ncbi:MAG TPA: BTAD domain-containing putative transcriptional regulator, partial [Euzebya sp.]|nr:BTAD domain-containing putative transcriptional regulator [Euzebya sp.]
MDQTIEYRLEVLGATRLLAGQREVTLTAAESCLLAGVALGGSSGAGDDRLMALLWPDAPPPSARQSLRNHVSRLRNKAGASLLRRTRTGYRLGASVDVDVRELDGFLAGARAAHERGDAVQVVEMADAAAAVATGEPFADLAGDRAAAGARSRLGEEMLHVEELCATALMRSGRLDRAIADLQRLTRTAPAREPRWELLLAALKQAGRRSEALGVYHEARRALIDLHGIEPGSKLRRLHETLLQVSIPDGAPAVADHALGRERDTAALIEQAQAGRSMVVTGQPGIGKSTVLRLVAREWAGPAVLVDCQENPWTALGPVQDLLTWLTVPLRSMQLPVDLAQLRPATSPESWDRPRKPGGLITRVAEVIAAGLGTLDPVLVLVDDIDRAGPTTREILVTALHQAGVPGIFACRGLSTG